MVLSLEWMFHCDVPLKDLKGPAAIKTNRYFYEFQSDNLIRLFSRLPHVREGNIRNRHWFATSADGAPEKFEAHRSV
jgi:hypothetical protein